MDEPAKRTILISALLNAIQHQGRADVKAVVTRVLAENPALRKIAKDVTDAAKDVVARVNRMDNDAQKALLVKLNPSILTEEQRKKEEARKKEQEKKGLPPLPDVDKYEKVVTRFAPNPDSVLHLGSTRAIILSHDYARLYNGKFILRFEDTDPRLKKSALHLYDYIKDDLEWLSCRPDEIYYQSDRLEIYYSYAEKLISLGWAYVCTCKPEVFRRLVLARNPCPCRDLPAEENLERWKRMLSGIYSEGEAVLRVKTDLNHPNPAVRDWPAMRIIDTKKYKHPRVGSRFRVWPLYNWSAGLDDHLMGITHIIRGQEHFTNAVRQKYFYDYFGWRYPTAIHYGRLKIEGAELSKSKVEQGIREGKYSGYDDPRLATLRALKRRGIRPEAIRKIIIEVGPKPADVTISWENLYAYNRQIVDPAAPRHSALFRPVMLFLGGIPEGKESYIVELPLHPSNPEMGKRSFRLFVHNSVLKVLISSDDIETFNTQKAKDIFRLMGLVNFEVTAYSVDSVYGRYKGDSLEEAKTAGAKSIQWLPENDYIRIKVVMNDSSIKSGIADRYLLEERVDTVVQFERLFFARVDKVDREKELVELYFTSK